jgi:hypothetical protein
VSPYAIIHLQFTITRKDIFSSVITLDEQDAIILYGGSGRLEFSCNGVGKGDFLLLSILDRRFLLLDHGGQWFGDNSASSRWRLPPWAPPVGADAVLPPTPAARVPCPA